MQVNTVVCSNGVEDLGKVIAGLKRRGEKILAVAPTKITRGVVKEFVIISLER